jgi:hypothetical protein
MLGRGQLRDRRKKGCRKLINMLSEADQTDLGFVAAQTEIGGS